MREEKKVIIWGIFCLTRGRREIEVNIMICTHVSVKFQPCLRCNLFDTYVTVGQMSSLLTKAKYILWLYSPIRKLIGLTSMILRKGFLRCGKANFLERLLWFVMESFLEGHNRWRITSNKGGIRLKKTVFFGNFSQMADPPFWEPLSWKWFILHFRP